MVMAFGEALSGTAILSEVIYSHVPPRKER